MRLRPVWLGLLLCACPANEPGTLSSTVLVDSFGVGSPADPVKWKQPKRKGFDFEFTSPVPAVVVLHYHARELSAGELVISLNGTEVGQAPADSPRVEERDNELLLPAALLKKGQPNQ